MNPRNLFSVSLLVFAIAPSMRAIAATPHPDVLSIAPDLENPAFSAGDPAPGKLVLQTLPKYAGTEVSHALYLPADWTPEKHLPVIVEYRGNTSRVQDEGGLGYGISGGKGFIWVVLPFVSADHKKDLEMWWGDVDATVAYAKEVVPAICNQFGGDPARVVLAGHSRGAIACNYIGLHDDDIAKMWCAVIAVSHYDDAHTAWGMTPVEKQRAPERLKRLDTTPQFICGEHTSAPRQSDAKLVAAIKEKNLTSFDEAKRQLNLVPLTEEEGTRKFVAKHHPEGRFTIIDFPSVNHTAKVFLRETPERQQLREWLTKALEKK